MPGSCAGDVLRSAANRIGSLFRSRDVEPVRNSPDETCLLRITSSCKGSMERIAEPGQKKPWRRDCTEEEQCAGPSWNGFCSVCKRPLTIEVAESAKRSRCEKVDSGRCAFVIALWGTSPEYVLGAMVLGWSLRRTGTQHDLVVVHTDDVSEPALALLKRAGWTPHLVEHVEVSTRIMDPSCKTMRFAKVFTKLRVLELVQYPKILMMDIDLLVQQNIDHLFDFEPPMAMVRGPKVGYNHGDRVDGSYFFSGGRDDGYSWGQSSGINAGVMLLRPDAQVYEQMMSEVTDAKHPEHIQGSGPEQDYLSRFYAGSWRHLSVAYNFQLHHMYFAISPVNTTGADRLEFMEHPERIMIVHYSSEPKPWARMLEECYSEWTDEQWLDEVLNSFPGYKAWVLKDKDYMKREGDRHNMVVGPDGHLHVIDWARVKPKPKWDRGGASQSNEDTPGSTTCDEDSCDKVDIQEKDDSDKMSEERSEPKEAEEDTGMFSEDGWPCGEARKVSEKMIEAAENTLRIVQKSWSNAYNELAVDLAEKDLAGAVRAATVGPIIRQDNSVWEWKKPATFVSSTWSREGTNGWWVEEKVLGRYVATCSTLSRVHASLSVGGKILLDADVEGVHVAAVDPEGGVCPCPQSFVGSDSVEAAASWAASLPDGAMVLLAAIDTVGERVGAVLQVLASNGLGCPTAMPPSDCKVAATIGQKGKGTWYCTHAASDVALASHCALPDSTKSSGD